MSMDAVKASATDRKRDHEAKLQRQILDRIAVVQPKRGDIMTLTVPKELFVWPGTKPEDVTEEQSAMMEACHQVLGQVIQTVAQSGVQLGGAAIIGEGMTLDNLPPPWEKHPDAREPTERVVVPGKKILLPPGTKI